MIFSSFNSDSFRIFLHSTILMENPLKSIYNNQLKRSLGSNGVVFTQNKTVKWTQMTPSHGNEPYHFSIFLGPLPFLHCFFCLP